MNVLVFRSTLENEGANLHIGDCTSPGPRYPLTDEEEIAINHIVAKASRRTPVSVAEEIQERAISHAE